jgi:hypothetical protein
VSDAPPGAAGWATVALLCGAAVLNALLDVAFMAQFYAGTVIVPVTILAAVVGNVLLPWLGRRAVGRTAGAVLPVVCWLVPTLVLTMYNRPEGDLFVIAEYQQQYAFYGLLIAGATAGFVTVVVLGGTPAGRRRPPAPAPIAKQPRTESRPTKRPAKTSPSAKRPPAGRKPPLSR